MPLELNEDDLKALARKGKLVRTTDGKRVAPLMPVVKASSTQAKPVADARVIAEMVASAERVLRANTEAMTAMLKGVSNLRETPVTVNVPESKAPKLWKAIRVTVTKRNAEGRISEIEMRKVE